jgi:hypothetical protein
MSAWRKSDVEEQKEALTRCVDHGRPAWGYEVRTYPRRTCLAFSTNDLEPLQDATGSRRYWPFSVIRDRVDVEGLRRDRDQLLAEALHRLKSGEPHWPTPEEEWRHIVPEQQKYMAETALEILAVLARFIVEEPLTTRPNRGDFAWKWQRRPQPLRELYLDAFFEKCFGMYAAVKRHGLDRASKKDIAYCTTWLRGNDWRRVEKRLPDGQRVMVWRAPDQEQDPHSEPTQGIESWVGTDRWDVAGIRGGRGGRGGRGRQECVQYDPRAPVGTPRKSAENYSQSITYFRRTQNNFSYSVAESKNLTG